MAPRADLTAERVSSPEEAGARAPDQLADNLGAWDIEFDAAQLSRLDEVSALDLGFPHNMLALDMTRSLTTGGLSVGPPTDRRADTGRDRSRTLGQRFR